MPAPFLAGSLARSQTAPPKPAYPWGASSHAPPPPWTGGGRANGAQPCLAGGGGETMSTHSQAAVLCQLAWESVPLHGWLRSKRRPCPGLTLRGPRGATPPRLPAPTFQPHAHRQALLEAAEGAPLALGLVDLAGLALRAGVVLAVLHRPLEEALRGDQGVPEEAGLSPPPPQLGLGPAPSRLPPSIFTFIQGPKGLRWGLGGDENYIQGNPGQEKRGEGGWVSFGPSLEGHEGSPHFQPPHLLRG